MRTVFDNLFLDLLERQCKMLSVMGFEGTVQEAIAEIVAPFVDEMRTDAFGNLIV